MHSSLVHEERVPHLKQKLKEEEIDSPLEGGVDELNCETPMRPKNLIPNQALGAGNRLSSI
jgi:hypothetical protein